MQLPLAVIFDLDETLAASAPLWRVAVAAAAGALGGALTEALWVECRGHDASQIAGMLRDAFAPGGAAEDARALLRGRLAAAFATEPLAPRPGAVTLVRRLAGRLPLAVASGSPRDVIRVALERLGLADCFRACVSTEEVGRGKPAPDVYLEAAARLGVPPRRCVACEDSRAGARAALAAGMACLVVPSGDAARFAGMDVRLFGSWAEVTDADVDGAL